MPQFIAPQENFSALSLDLSDPREECGPPPLPIDTSPDAKSAALETPAPLGEVIGAQSVISAFETLREARPLRADPSAPYGIAPQSTSGRMRPSQGWGARGDAHRLRGIRAYLERLEAEEKRRHVVAGEQVIAVAMQGREIARLDQIIARGAAAPAVFMARAEALARFEDLVHLQDETVRRHNEEANFINAEIARWRAKLEEAVLTNGVTPNWRRRR